MSTKKTNEKGLRDLPKIKKLADKKGTPLLDVSFGKGKSIHFKYKVGYGVIGFSYSSVLQGMAKELARLGRQ